MTILVGGKNINMNGNIGMEIKLLRKSAGLTQTELAEKLSVTKAAISAYENGTRHPSFKVLGKLNTVLGLQVFTDKDADIDDEVRYNPLKENLTKLLEFSEDILMIAYDTNDGVLDSVGQKLQTIIQNMMEDFDI